MVDAVGLIVCLSKAAAQELQRRSSVDGGRVEEYASRIIERHLDPVRKGQFEYLFAFSSEEAAPADLRPSAGLLNVTRANREVAAMIDVSGAPYLVRALSEVVVDRWDAMPERVALYERTDAGLDVLFFAARPAA